MRTTPKVFIIAGLFAGAFPNAAPGQFRPPRPDQGPRVLYYEAFPVPLSADSLHERIDVHYRIDREFFVPVRDPEEHSPFHRSGEITVELADSTGGIAARSMRSLDITETDADRKPLGERWEQGIFQLTVPRGNTGSSFRRKTRNPAGTYWTAARSCPPLRTPASPGRRSCRSSPRARNGLTGPNSR